MSTSNTNNPSNEENSLYSWAGKNRLEDSFTMEEQALLLSNAIRLATTNRAASIYLLRNRLNIEPSHAVELLQQMQRLGIIGPEDKDGTHRVLGISPLQRHSNLFPETKAMPLIHLACPKCKLHNDYSISSYSGNSLRCHNCKTDFFAWTVLIRAKKSKGNRSNNSRDFSVRVVDYQNQEHLIEFTNHNYDDFDLRTKDRAAFIYLNNELKAVHNFTINKYWNIYRNQYKGISRSLSTILGIIYTILIASMALAAFIAFIH